MPSTTASASHFENCRALLIAVLSGNKVRRLSRMQLWSRSADATRLAFLLSLRSMGLVSVCWIGMLRNRRWVERERERGRVREREGARERKDHQERASESGNYPLTCPPSHPTDRFCQEMNLAPQAQPVWYAAEASDRARSQTQTRQRPFTSTYTVSTWELKKI